MHDNCTLKQMQLQRNETIFFSSTIIIKIKKKHEPVKHLLHSPLSSVLEFQFQTSTKLKCQVVFVLEDWPFVTKHICQYFSFLIFFFY